MAPAPSDFTLIGTVLAVSIAIILLSGLALYVAFRLRETLKDERGGGARAAKVAFLVGLLFLSGGVFYYFASGFSSQAGGSTTLIISTTTSGTSTASSSTSSSSTSSLQAVSMPAPSCAGSRQTAGSTFNCTVYVYNSGSTFTSATLVSGGDLTKFTFISCTEQVNGGATSTVPSTGDSVSVGTLYAGTTVLTLTVQAPTQQGQDSNSMLTLNAVGFTQPVSVTFTIQVTA